VAGQAFLFEVSAGGLHTCAISGDGETYCWGFNRVGQLGNNSTADANLPQLIGTSFSGIEAGGLHTCGIGSEGQAWCWGFNRSGAVGDGTSTNRSAPVQVSGSNAYQQLAAGLHHTCGLTVERNVL